MPTASMPCDTWQEQLNALADTRDAYFEILRSTGQNPMDNETFKDWILNNAHPGFAERLDDFEPSEAFGSSF